MAKPDKRADEQREIIRAQNDALSRLPKDLNDRVGLTAGYRQDLDKQNNLIAQVKRDVGADETLKRLLGTYGFTKLAIKFINENRKQAPAARAATLRLIIKHGEDVGDILPDLFDHGAIGVGVTGEAAEEASAGALFDQTPAGQQRGGAKAQPRTVEEMAASNENGGTPGIPLAEAERLFEEFLAKNPVKAGRVAKAVTEEKARLIAQIEAAKADAALADKPEAKPGEITGALREGNAESEQHIREAVDRPAAPPPPAEKPKRGRKAADTKAPPPPPPPAEDEDEGEDQPGLPVHRPDSLGTAPSTFQVG